jgi:SnoaL-like domain
MGVSDHATGSIAAHNLFACYAAALDDHDFRVLERVLASYVEFGSTVKGGAVNGPFRGRKDTIAYITRTVSAQHDQRRHVITNIHQQGMTALAYLTLIGLEGGKASCRATGRYRCELAVEEDALRFSRISLSLDCPP